MTNWHGEAPVGRTHEWYTPPSLFEAMGAIFDLDPAPPEAHGGAPSRRSARRALLSRLLSTARRAAA